MNRSTPGLPVHHQLPEFTQTQVHRVSDAIQLSHPLSSPSPPALNPSQHQSLFQWVNSLHEAAKVVEFQLQHHSLQRNPGTDLLQNGRVGSPCSPRDSQESSPTPQFKSINSLVLSFLKSPTLISIHDHWKNHRLVYMDFVGKVMSLLFNMLSRLLITFQVCENALRLKANIFRFWRNILSPLENLHQQENNQVKLIKFAKASGCCRHCQNDHFHF